MSAAKTDSPNGVGAHVVGPAAGFDDVAKDSVEHKQWSTVRKAVATLAKRMDLTKESPDSRAAPSVSEDDDDLGHRQYAGFVGDIISPPFPLRVLCSLGENSSALRQNIDAMATNIDGFGHSFKSILDFASPDINNQVRDLMVRKNLDAREGGAPADLMELTSADLDEITPGVPEIEEQKLLWQRIAAIEKGRIESFFEFINPLKPFTEVRTATRGSKELLGNAGWEVIRENVGDVRSKVCQVYNVPFVNVSLIRSDDKPTKVTTKIRKDKIHFDEVDVERFFRRYVRITGAVRVYYKQFGDPRTVSRDTGRYYKSVEALEAEEEGAKPANEFFHWAIESEVSAYGVPRWIGTLVSVMGSRASEEVNFLYFDNKAIPPMVLLVSGGRVSQDSVERIESYIEERIKGRENFHKIMVIEGLPAQADSDAGGGIEHGGKLRLELIPLLGNQMQDGLFQKYDANNIVKIGRSFRQPQILTGDTRDMNRSTAEVAKAFAEEQIYQPARVSFDDWVDRHLLVNLGIHFWRFTTNAPVQRMPNDLVANVAKSLNAGGIVPNEARKLLSDAFSMDLEYRTEDWAEVPPTLAEVAARAGAMPSADGLTGLESDAEDLVEIQSADADGEVVARGRTSLAGGTPHDHVFVAVREGAGIRVLTLPGGKDDHTHSAAPLQVQQGAQGSVEVSGVITEGEDSAHTHQVEFSVPLTKRRKRARNLALALHHMRQSIEDEVKAAKTEFFDPATLDYE